MPILVRAEIPADHDAITAVHDAAFGRPGEGRLVTALRATAAFRAGLSLVAEADGAVVGHVLLYPVHVNDRTRRREALALAPMAVVPAWQRLGVGGQLMEESIVRAREMGYLSIVVLGHADYYPRFGFVPASAHDVRAPFPGAEHAYFVRELVPAALAGVRGVVEYPREFAAV